MFTESSAARLLLIPNAWTQSTPIRISAGLGFICIMAMWPMALRFEKSWRIRNRPRFTTWPRNRMFASVSIRPNIRPMWLAPALCGSWKQFASMRRPATRCGFIRPDRLKCSVLRRLRKARTRRFIRAVRMQWARWRRIGSRKLSRGVQAVYLQRHSV